MTLLGQTLPVINIFIEQNRNEGNFQINGLIFLFLLIVCCGEISFSPRENLCLAHTMKVIALSNDNDRRFIGLRRGRIEKALIPKDIVIVANHSHFVYITKELHTHTECHPTDLSSYKFKIGVRDDDLYS